MRIGEFLSGWLGSCSGLGRVSILEQMFRRLKLTVFWSIFRGYSKIFCLHSILEYTLSKKMHILSLQLLVPLSYPLIMIQLHLAPHSAENINQDDSLWCSPMYPMSGSQNSFLPKLYEVRMISVHQQHSPTTKAVIHHISNPFTGLTADQKLWSERLVNLQTQQQKISKIKHREKKD